MRLRLIFTAIIVLAACCRIDAQTPENGVNINVKITPDSISIGDRATLEITVSCPTTGQMVFPEVEAGKEFAKGLELVSSEEPDTLKSKEKDVTSVRKRYIITSFDEGEYPFAGFPLLYVSENKVDTLFCETPATLRVKTVDIPDDFKPYDIKGLHTYPSEWWIVALIVLLSLIIITAALWIILGREKMVRILTGTPVPVKPPYEKAIEKLQKLKLARLPESGKVKEYYTELTNIIREYIEGRTGLNVMEKTSGEILDTLPSTEFNTNEHAQYLRDLFYYSDLAKFAKYIPNTAENEQSWQCAYTFVESGKPVPVADEGNEIVNDELKIKNQ